MVLKSFKILTVALIGSGQVSLAANYLSTSVDRGLKSTQFTGPSGYVELCTILNPMPGVTYKKGDLEDLEKLCQLDFYLNTDSSETAVCPKMYSTSPALEFDQFKEAGKPNKTYAANRSDYEAQFCSEREDRPGKKLAKFKHSLTCSYTSSPLAYYQLSLYFGGILNIPDTVLRTMDKEAHLQQVERAIPYVRKHYSSNPKEPMRLAWEQYWPAAHRDPQINAKSVKGSNLFTDDLKGVYGSLIQNPRGEEKYYEVSGRGTYEGRYERLKRQQPYRNVADSRPVSSIVPRDFANAAQTIVQMKDVSDMVIMDTLLNQQDRVGNIAYRPYAYYLVNGKVKSKKVDFEDNGNIKAKDLQKLQAEGAQQITVVKEMLLKDNDCGVAKENMARENNWLEGLSHVNKNTYYQLLRLAQDVQKPEIKAYFMNELLFDENDWNGNSRKFKSNVEFAANSLKEKCLSGKLMLDLDLQAFLDGTLPSSFKGECELP